MLRLVDQDTDIGVSELSTPSKGTAYQSESDRILTADSCGRWWRHGPASLSSARPPAAHILEKASSPYKQTLYATTVPPRTFERIYPRAIWGHWCNGIQHGHYFITHDSHVHCNNNYITFSLNTTLTENVC